MIAILITLDGVRYNKAYICGLQVTRLLSLIYLMIRIFVLCR